MKETKSPKQKVKKQQKQSLVEMPVLSTRKNNHYSKIRMEMFKAHYRVLLMLIQYVFHSQFDAEHTNWL